MNEQAIIDSYNVFVSQGYTKSLEEYKKLIATNPNALQDSYNAFASQGYGKSIDDYKVLMGIGQSPSVEKKSPVATGSSSEGASLGSSSQETEDDGILSKIGNAALKAQAATMLGAKKVAEVTTGLLASPLKWFLDQSDNIVNAEKNMLKQGGFFDEDMPETEKPMSDALKQQLEKSKLKGESPLDPRVIIGGVATIANKIINSAIPEKQRNSIINNLALTSNSIQSQIRDVEAYQEKTLPKNIPTQVASNILYMSPELFAASKMGGTAAAESKAAELTKKATEKSIPFIKNNAPKAAKVLEESIVAPFTKIMATEAAVKAMADTKEGENVFWNGVEGAAEGTLEGMYMHGLGMAAGQTAKPISKIISKAGINSAIATAIASPLSNAGVFTSARALRTAATEQRMLTPEEAVMEASMGVGFSLLHLKQQFDTQNEANHYYDNVLNDDARYSFSRVLNETKANLDLAYNPDLTPEKVKELQEARDEIKKAILREPDIEKKKLLGNEAIKIQNQLDANNNIQAIVRDKDFLISKIKQQDDLSNQQKDFFINKIEAIADTYDRSEFAVRKRELNTEIMNLDNELSDLSEKFTNSKLPSERATLKAFIDAKRIKLGELNNELTELITNKQKENAVQKQTTDEGVLLGQQPELGLQKVGEGDTQLEITPEQKQAITDEKDAFQKILDNPDNHDETDVQEAKDYFADPIKYYEEKIKFYEEEVNPTEDDKASLEYFKKMFEAHKAAEVKPETKTIKAGEGVGVIETTPETITTPAPAKGTTITIGAGGATVSEGRPTEVTTGGEGTETKTSSLSERLLKSNLSSFLPKIKEKLQNVNKIKTIGDYIDFIQSLSKENLIRTYKDIFGNVSGLDQMSKDFTRDISVILYKGDKGKEGKKGKPLPEGLISSYDIINPIDESNVLVKRGDEITKEVLEKLDKVGIAEISVLKDGVKMDTEISQNDIFDLTASIGDMLNKVNSKIPSEGATVSEGKPTEVTTGGEGTETKTSGTDIVKTKKNEDNEHVVTLNGEEVGKIYYDPSQKTWNNANFSRAGEKPYTAKWIYGDVLGESKQQAIDEVIKRHKESAPKKEEPQKVQYTKDNILNRFLNKLNELNPLQKNPIDNKSFVYGDKASLEFNRFDKGDKNEVALESIMSLDKNKGAGSAVMKDITAAADALGVKLTLDAKPFGREGLTKQQLVDFYKKNGFKVDFEDAYGGEFKSEQELLDYALQHESEAIPMSREPKTSTEIKAGEGVGVSEGKPTEFTMAEGRETKTGVMDDIELLIPKYKEYVDRDLQKAKDKYRINKSEANKKALDKAKAAAEEYKKEVADKKEEALKLLTESSEYKNADPTQQDALVKEVLRKFGERIKKAPSAETILGIEPPKVVTMTEKAALKEQIKAFARGVKEGLKTAKDLMERRKVFAAAINQIEKSGLISSSKVSSLLNKISKVNLEDDAAVEKVIEYAEKLFADAEYDNKLNAANNERGAIKKLASNKKKNADLSVFAKKFLKIRPSDVENIDEYNEMAKKIRESLEGSKITKDKNNPIKLADMIDIAKMGDYVDKMLEAQAKIDKDKLIKSARGIMGDDATFLSDDEVLELIKTGQVEKNEKVDDSLLKKITERVDRIFESSAAMVEEILRTGKDPLTGEDIDLSEGRKKIVERFMSMDMKDLSDREKLGVIDALNNFIRNGSVANMETVYADYKAKDSLAKAIENNVVAKKLKLFFSKKTGRAFGQQISTLPNLAEQMFRGVEASKEFKRLSGITDLVNKKAAVQRTMNVLTDSFIKEFYNQKANGKAFDTAENVAERGIIAAMKRDIPGTPEQQKAEFVRKKKLAEKSIELLRDGNEQERKLADVYQKAYDKVLKDSNTVDEVLKKSDDKNIEAVDWWIDKWSDIYDQLAEVTEGIYNEKLDRDLNYTNFKFSFLSGGAKAPELSSRESVFLNSNNDIFGKGVYKKKAGVLEKSTRPEADGMEDMYFDLSFDRNMINAYQDALMDINTAGTVRQIESFFSSKAIKKIIPNKEDRDLLFRNNGKEGVVPDLIRTTRQRQVVQTDELTSVLRKLSNLGTAGAATALAGVTQPIKQTIPVAINTLINAGKMPDLFYFRNKDKVDFINNSQRAIAIRGGKSRVNVDSINKLAEAAATSKTTKAIEMLGKINEIALKTLVEKPDVWIAKASWITYYEKALKKQGTDPNKIDWKTHEINDAAADYAQDMVDRQQNISDADLQGKLMNTKDPLKSVMVKTVMPFASFRMNQTMRMYSDLKTAFSKKGQATKEDRVTALKSLAGYSAEMASFKYLQYFIASTLATAAVEAMGINETDDDKKKREEILKRSQTTGTVTDIFSPLPMLDLPVAIGADKALSYFQDLEGIDEEDKFNLMTSVKQNGAKSLGLYGIAIDKANSIIEAFEISTTGKYTDEYGREKYVSNKTANALGDIALMSTGSSLIGFPSEMNAVLRNSLRLAKKNSSTKPGGKEAYVRQSSERRTEVLKKKEAKMKVEVEALNRMLREELDPIKIKEIRSKIREAKEAPYKRTEQSEEEKLTRKEEKEKMEEMLQGYNSKSDMERYDTDLYEKTFGEGSDYYEENKAENEVKSDLSKEKKQMKDEEYNYYKSKKRKKNKDGTYKKKYFRSYYRGN